MRADRLIAELMLLQTRGKVSAAEMAAEMEVSQRTIYRDMLALNTAGIPIFAENGSSGGYQLVDGYRTQLTGFNSGELQALFAMNIPAILGELGMDGEAKAAVRKLQASLSRQQNEESSFMTQRFLYDPTNWENHQRNSNNTVLNLLQKAIWEDQIVEITIQYWFRPGEIRLQIAPYALVLKNNQWYLVYKRNDSFRVQNLQEIAEVIERHNHFQRDDNFDLAVVWGKWYRSQQQQMGHFKVTLLLKENAEKVFKSNHNTILKTIQPAETGWLRVECTFNRLEEARGELLQWGSAIRILEPEVLRLSMLDFAEQFLQQNK